MSDDIELLDDGEQVTREHVQARVENWQSRIREFYSLIRAWAEKNDWKVNDSGRVEMLEELMQEYEIPPAEQPVLRLDRGAQFALFFPKGLWVIGANGRIDLITPKGSFIIVDLANQFAEPKWMIFRTEPNSKGKPFSPDMIESLM